LTVFAADFSDAIDGAESFSARLTEALSGAGAFSEAGVPETAATGTGGAATAAVTAANASASPAPNKSSRPGAPRSRASEPGEIDGGVVERGLARFQIAPDFDRGPGFLDVFEKCPF